MENMKEQIITLAKKYAMIKPESINSETKFSDDLAYDSIRLVSFVIEIEEVFHIEVDDNILSTINTSNIKNIVDYVSAKINEK